MTIDRSDYPRLTHVCSNWVMNGAAEPMAALPGGTDSNGDIPVAGQIQLQSAPPSPPAIPSYVMVRVSEALDLDRPDGYMQFAERVGMRARPVFEVSDYAHN
jgi:hypothetical protein